MDDIRISEVGVTLAKLNTSSCNKYRNIQKYVTETWRLCEDCRLVLTLTELTDYMELGI